MKTNKSKKFKELNVGDVITIRGKGKFEICQSDSENLHRF